ncbi:hypothetical protein HAPAU_14800 [Halalkalicoccus paucihalophilus]|uniref:Uncharacterized protein n=1 Tax=Halalkalicoccus paucihalophilus TaxID=1008153 RepID=A0A151AFP1_9EURY|nr:hypothetical protein [Halalkalicoccus paucihalophilus]KYH26382.1 hypothetical protein HAPAU_14800 [Halalkalicoccus paucihalophilus]
MTIPLSEALEEAHYVTFSGDRRVMAVWYGAHTVSFFLADDPAAITHVESVPIGEYRFGETSREDAEGTIESTFAEYRGEIP